MIYFLYGTDVVKSQNKASELRASLLSKKPNASFFKLDSESFTEVQLDELVGGQGLFEHKYIVYLDRVMSTAELKANIVGKLKELGESENIFIVREESVTKEILKKIEKYAAKVQEFVLRTMAPKEEFKVFSLADALGSRDKKKLWVLYQKAKNAGVEDEQMHGILWWQVKNMEIAVGSSSAGEAGLNPFVWKKAKSYASNFSPRELRSTAMNLIDIYHGARTGAFEFDVALEKFILSI